MKLGVNIDHVATVREARKTFEPDPVHAVSLAEEAGCDSIVCHLRKDRRHINDDDLARIKKAVLTRLNLEMSVNDEIVEIACRTEPDQATLVPENRQEITTEGGLDVVRNIEKIKKVVRELQSFSVEVSLFIDPEKEQIMAAKESGVHIVEFHTGRYAEVYNAGGDHVKEARIIAGMTDFAVSKDIFVCAGHGLTYDNVMNIARIKGIYELNIGHSIISRSVFDGLKNSVKKMKELIS